MTSSCQLCGSTRDLTQLADSPGHVCEPCAERGRNGKDTTTQRARQVQRALRVKADNVRAVAAGGTVSETDSFAAEAQALLALDSTPASMVALDAGAHRLDLLSALGADCVALSLNLAESLQAANGAERLLCDQLAVLHQVMMTCAGRAALHPHEETAVKLLNASIRASESYRTGLQCLKKFRCDGSQRIVIERVDVQAGAQAAIGNFESKGVL